MLFCLQHIVSNELYSNNYLIKTTDRPEMRHFIRMELSGLNRREMRHIRYGVIKVGELKKSLRGMGMKNVWKALL